MADRLKKGEESVLIPWVAPIKLKSDAPKEILNNRSTERNVGIHVVRVQSDNGGEFSNGQLISGCQSRGRH
eukprot:5389041-Prorocentrum_lima.AAC.1